MKKIFATFLSIMIIANSLLLTANAAPVNTLTDNFEVISENIEYLSDGTSVTITVLEEKDALPTRATSYTKSGAKNYTAKDSNGNILWTFTVKGTFTVNSGVSATCTSTSYSTSNLSSGWELDSASTYASSNTAVGDATFKHKTLFITTDTKSCHVVLTCDANGNLS
ncbi:MAG: hypothetical protein IJ439_01675 [Tyzzerella sp.]|nr:hypothetical protein [Tyzzerella sp.]